MSIIRIFSCIKYNIKTIVVNIVFGMNNYRNTNVSLADFTRVHINTIIIIILSKEKTNRGVHY